MRPTRGNHQKVWLEMGEQGIKITVTGTQPVFQCDMNINDVVFERRHGFSCCSCASTCGLSRRNTEMTGTRVMAEATRNIPCHAATGGKYLWARSSTCASRKAPAKKLS